MRAIPSQADAEGSAPAAARGARLCGIVALAVSLLTGVVGCVAPAPETQGGELYRHNWWNYYARGLYFLKERRVPEAQADFQRCLGQLPGAKFGNARDLWRARTYGLHFVEGYFPNRELGVCLYERGDIEGAIRHLERSLEQEPSGRAKHYLNLARARRLKESAVPAPTISVNGAEAFAFTRERTLPLAGAAAAGGFVRALSVGGRPEFVELAAPTLSFSRSVALASGTNAVELAAEDLLGQRTVLRLVRVADWQPPRFLVRQVIPQAGAWLIQGVCRDENGLSDVASGGQQLFLRAPGATPAEVPVSLRLPPGGAELTATDLAGNRLVCALDGAALAQMALARPAVEPRGRQADRISGTEPTLLDRWASWERGCLSAPGGAVRFAALTEPAGGGTAGGGDRLRPALSLRGCQPLTRVFAEEFFVDGTAADGGGLKAVSVNGENLLAAADLGAVRTYFARRLPLDLGTNRFEIVAMDRSGNRTSQNLTVVRATPEYLEEKFRLSVGVPPLSPAEAGAVGARAKRSMEAELTSEPVRFRLLERDEGWDFVMREQGLSASDLADPAAALRIGKMVPAEMLLMGKIFSEAKGVTVYLKAVETANGEVLFASDVYTPDAEGGLDEAVSGLVLKVEQGFPLVTGEVLRHQGSRVTLNVGLRDGAAEKSRFLVLSGDEEHRVFRSGEAPVELQVERVQQNTSTARVIPSGADASVKEGCYVYSR